MENKMIYEAPATEVVCLYPEEGIVMASQQMRGSSNVEDATVTTGSW